MKNKIGKAMADLAIGLTKANVNSTCVFIMHQRNLPLNIEKLKKK